MTLSVDRAGLFRRVAAMLYDGLVVLALWLVATMALIPFFGAPAQDEVQVLIPGAYQWLYQGYLLAICAAFFCFFWLRGQTLGMVSWRLKVVDRQGLRISHSQALLRFVGALLCWASCGLGYLWILFDRQGRSWADILSSTEVVVLPKSRD